MECGALKVVGDGNPSSSATSEWDVLLHVSAGSRPLTRGTKTHEHHTSLSPSRCQYNSMMQEFTHFIVPALAGQALMPGPGSFTKAHRMIYPKCRPIIARQEESSKFCSGSISASETAPSPRARQIASYFLTSINRDSAACSSRKWNHLSFSPDHKNTVQGPRARNIRNAVNADGGGISLRPAYLHCWLF